VGGADPEYAADAECRKVPAADRAPDRLLAYAQQRGDLGDRHVARPESRGPKLSLPPPARRLPAAGRRRVRGPAESGAVEQIELYAVRIHRRPRCGALPIRRRADHLDPYSALPGESVSQFETSVRTTVLSREARGEDFAPVLAPRTYAELGDGQREHLIEADRQVRGQMNTSQRRAGPQRRPAHVQVWE